MARRIDSIVMSELPPSLIMLDYATVGEPIDVAERAVATQLWAIRDFDRERFGHQIALRVFLVFHSRSTLKMDAT